MASWLTIPWASHDQSLHAQVAGLLDEWREDSGRQQVVAVHVVGESQERLSRELRDLFERGGVRYRFTAVDSAEGRELLQRAGCRADRLPVAILAAGRVLVQPAGYDVAAAAGVRLQPDPRPYDVAVVGAGAGRPVGSGLRRLRGAPRGSDRTRDNRRPGREQLADPQLPGLPQRHQRPALRPQRAHADAAVRRRARLRRGGRAAAGGEGPGRADAGRRRRPPHVLNRVCAYDVAGSVVVIPIGRALSGPVAQVAGARQVMLVSACCAVTVAAAMVAVPAIRGLRRTAS
jgi:hypothetical protein